MLYIKLGYRDKFYDIPNFIWQTDGYFNNNYEDEWLDDPLVKQMILDIDKSEVISPYCIMSPVLGQISPTKLSGGVKTLILMLKEPENIFYASNCGDNCSKWIRHIGEIQDLHIILGYHMTFGTIEDEMEAIIENDGTHITNVNEFIRKCLDYLD